MLKKLAILVMLPLLGASQEPEMRQQFVPGSRYDPAIPTLEEVVGHDFGERITPPDQVFDYFETLAAAAPERTRLIRYATSWEGRPLVALVIGSPARIGNLDAIKEDLVRLADPRGMSDADAEELIGRLPVVTALMHAVHGNEISSSGAAMAEAYHLLAAQNDPAVDLIFAESLVIIDPLENPDGRNRFVYQNSVGEARWPDAKGYSAEHDEPWPGGRGNHYLFDLNRDLFIQSQPETRGKVALFLEFWPHIVVDLHEMGGNSTYFFPPTAEPSNPWFGERQIALMNVFGRANATAFDERGFAYFNRDVYDLFYPGYVDMWPMSHGALGMTFEQASARGLALERSDGDTLTYAQGVLQHFTAAMTTAETAAGNREQILSDYLAFRREGVASGQEGPAELVLHASTDPARAERLARMLARNGIEVREAMAAVTVGERTLPAAGTYIVPMSQPAYRFARDLLDDHVPMDETFIERQLELRSEREDHEIYDITAWSQPLLWDVEVIAAATATGAAGDLVAREPLPAAGVSGEAMSAGIDPAGAGTTLAPAQVGYLIPWGVGAAATVTEALREGVRVRSAGGEFTLGGREYAVGTAIVRTAENDDDLPAVLGRLAAAHGAEVVPIDDSYVSEGMSLGSNRVSALREPRVLLVYDEPASSLSAGWARYVLERRYGQRTTAVRAASLGRADLDDFDVVVFPSGNYADAVGDGLLDQLRDWMRDGGTVITMAESTRWATRADLLATAAERRGGRLADEDPPAADTPEQPIDYLEKIVPADEAPEAVPGAILRVLLDTDHWLASGTDGDIGVLVDGSRVFRPITLDDGTNVGRYAGVEELVLGGVVWDESRPQLASKAFLIVQPYGAGQLVAFAEDPNYRAYAEATQLLFMNAVLLGPGR